MQNWGDQMHTKTGRGFLALFVTVTRMVSGLLPGSKSIINRKPKDGKPHEVTINEDSAKMLAFLR